MGVNIWPYQHEQIPQMRLSRWPESINGNVDKQRNKGTIFYGGTNLITSLNCSRNLLASFLSDVEEKIFSICNYTSGGILKNISSVHLYFDKQCTN